MALKEYVLPGGATYKLDDEEAKERGGLPATEANIRKQRAAGANKAQGTADNKSDD